MQLQKRLLDRTCGDTQRPHPPRDVPLEGLGPLACGVQTGAGAIINVLKPDQAVLRGGGGVVCGVVWGWRVSILKPWRTEGNPAGD